VNLTVIDDEGTLDDASVIITVNGVIAWSSDAQQNSFVVTKTVVTNGNRYEITPPASFPTTSAVSVRAEADDGVNTLDETYHFFVDTVGLLDDHFGGVGVNIQAGNGTITSADGKLVTDSTGGQNLDWFTFGRNGTIGLVPITNLMKDHHKVVYFETELASWVTANSSNSHTLWGLYLSNSNFYWIYTHDGLNWNAYKTVNNSWVFQGAYPGNPAPALPTRIRFVWDRSANTIAWQIFDGVWEDIVAPQTISFTPTDVHFGHKTYSSLPAATSQYEELLIYAEEELLTQRTELAQTIDEASLNPNADAGLVREDFFVGPKKYGLGISTGVEIPGPPQQQGGSVGPFDDVGAQDSEVFPDAAGPTHRAFPASRGLNIGGLVDENVGHAITASPEDEVVKALLGTQATYHLTTIDGDLNAHFSELLLRGAFYYNTAGEDWANPVASSLTGYARDGNRYTAGVQDGGPVQAPWASEAFSVTRGNRDDFPERVLIVWTEDTITIFDVTNFPANLAMWMRFIANSAFHIIGNTNQTITDVKMINGVLCVSTAFSSPARFHMIDFKGDTTANTAHIIGPDNHWRWNNTIVGRNSGNFWTTASVSPSLRIDSEELYSLAVYRKGTDSYYAVAGEDNARIIKVPDSVGTVPQKSFPTLVVNAPVNLGDIRHVCVDEFGWLWQSDQTRLVRNATQWTEGGVIVEDRENKSARGVSDFWPKVELPRAITQLVAARGYIYCATDVGIYRVKRGTLEVELAYTIVGGGGGGRLNNPPDGEIILGDRPEILWLAAYSVDLSSYLSVATYQGVVTIRLYDDFITQGLVYPALFEHRAYFNTSIVS
ncbi:MAG: hypothetical protein ACYTEQ_21975, partial [Planctomycetota bacterium]